MPANEPNPNRAVYLLAGAASFVETVVAILWSLGVATDASASRSSHYLTFAVIAGLYGGAVVITWLIAFNNLKS